MQVQTNQVLRDSITKKTVSHYNSLLNYLNKKPGVMSLLYKGQGTEIKPIDLVIQDILAWRKLAKASYCIGPEPKQMQRIHTNY